MIGLMAVEPARSRMESPSVPATFRFGDFELDADAGELRRNSRRVKLQPQPFKLLLLLVRRPGALVSRDEIRRELWPEGTFVDFDQAVNFAVKQIRDALGDAAERPLYLETVPRRGYRFIAPVNPGEMRPAGPVPSGTTVHFQKALWTNIAELRMAEARRRRYTVIAGLVLAALFAGLALFVLFSK
jgi:DNA-binding winged helix-turn-helix (wHTH) protein